MTKHNPLIVALDLSSPLKALNYVRRLKVAGVGFKVGYELFLSGGKKIVDKIISHDVRVFLDLKFHDIPNTVARAAETATKMGVWMFNVHASGGLEMMKRAKEASLNMADKTKCPTPLIVGVTVLTSIADLTETNISLPLSDQVSYLANLAKKGGLDGVVASGQEAPLIRKRCGDDFCIVTPGIRFSDSPPDDQERKVTPREALSLGSNYLVIGRPIWEHPKPLEIIEKILC